MEHFFNIVLNPPGIVSSQSQAVIQIGGHDRYCKNKINRCFRSSSSVFPSKPIILKLQNVKRVGKKFKTNLLLKTTIIQL